MSSQLMLDTIHVENDGSSRADVNSDKIPGVGTTPPLCWLDAIHAKAC